MRCGRQGVSELGYGQGSACEAGGSAYEVEGKGSASVVVDKESVAEVAGMGWSGKQGGR